MAFTLIDNTILEDKELSAVHKMIYVALAKFADNDTRACYPSYATLAEQAGCNRSTAIRAMKKLVEKGYVVKAIKSKDGRNAHACNLYILPLLESSANADKVDSTDICDTQSKLPSLRQAFPHEERLHQDDTDNSPAPPPDACIIPPRDIMPLPDASTPPPSGTENHELDLLNYTHSNYDLLPPQPNENRAAQKPAEQKKYGINRNVILNESEYAALKQDFPLDYEMRIERLSNYMKANGKDYDNHLAVIRLWATNDTPPPKSKRQKPDYAQCRGESL